MKDLLANPDVQKLIRMWRRNSRGARLVQEYFDLDPAAALDFLNSQLTLHDMARDLAHEPPEFRKEVLQTAALYLADPKGDC